MLKQRENKFCSLCFENIPDDTKYNVFKHNTLFKDHDGIWHGLMKHYVCADCMKKLQAYCQEHSIDKK